MRKRRFTVQIGIPVSAEFKAALTEFCNYTEVALAEYCRAAIEGNFERDQQLLSDNSNQMEESK
ncbi:MAG: hypothetical protein C4576_13800 [Desulfobacteraceae bacterium]|nr:MAG: hypothetical protein C4576_13800 [Desulfobacteraceae bacterium]